MKKETLTNMFISFCFFRIQYEDLGMRWATELGRGAFGTVFKGKNKQT